MKIKPLVFIGFLQIIFASLCYSADKQITNLHMMAPGFSIEADNGIAGSTEPAKIDGWYGVSYNDSQLEISPVSKTRTPDWLLAVGKGSSTPGSMTHTSFGITGSAFDLPADALFAIKLEDAEIKPVLIKPGKYPTLLHDAGILQEGWKSALNLRGKKWILSTRYKHRPQGGLLAGSMELLATDEGGNTTVLIPQATGMAFNRQELLWVGDISADVTPDVLIKRTWVTGEIDYVLRIGAVFNSLYIDPDDAYQAFSSGVDDYLHVSKNIRQHLPIPGGIFGQSAFVITEEAFNTALESAEKKGGGTLEDRQLKINENVMRFTFEYLPRAISNDVSSQSRAAFWDGAVSVKVHFQGKTQTIMQMPGLDGGQLKVQIDKIDGRPAIQIQSSPHYNNSFEHYWIWQADDARFVRLLTNQMQGC